MEEEIREWLQKLKQTEKLIIVEGPNDKKALESLGVKNIRTLNKALFEVIEEVAESNKEVIILTDLDKKGRELYHTLKAGLEKHGVKVDKSFRNFLFKTELSHIEGLTHYIKKKMQS